MWRPLFLTLLLAFIACASHVEVARRDKLPAGWTIIGDPKIDHTVHFVVFVKQQNLHALATKFRAVSDPKNADYGRFLTLEEANALIAPTTEAMQSVELWLSQYPEAQVTKASDHFEVRAPVAVASQMLAAEFKNHRHASGKSIVRAQSISVPSHISQHVHFVAGATELFVSRTSGHIAAQRTAAPLTITPKILKNFYNVPLNLKSTSGKNLNGIAAFNDRYDPKAFQAFQRAYNLTPFTTTNFGPTDGAVADYVESDLDVQYISAMSEGTDLYFVQEPNGYWILQFLIDAEKNLNGKIPRVFSISYGWFELGQCMWASINCPRLGYTGEVYVNRTDTALQIFGATGVSVFVASGDDGSPSYYCPVDPDYQYCGSSGCYNNKTSCPAITFTKTSTGAVCNLPALAMREQQPGCLNIYQAVPSVVSALIKANPKCDLQFSYGLPLQSKCACEDITPVTVNGVTGKGFVFNQTAGNIFAPIWPGSSPFVTSVGATYFETRDGKTPYSEIVSSSLTGAIFSSGGGFSYFQNAEPYQAAAAEEWVRVAGDKAPPSWSFNTTYRGFPDIAFNGNNYDVYLSATSHQPISGTSASSPAAAGLFSLINDILLGKGKTPLGFLNPLLYQMAKDHPVAFNDLTSGDNRCDGALCCKYGFHATPGWDPASGLGSPNFPEILRYVKKVKGL